MWLGKRLTLTYLLNLFDLYCTMQFVNRYGIEVEANPIGRYLIDTNLAIPVKTIGIGAALVALYAGVKRKPQYAWAVNLVLIVYAILAIYHLYIMEAIL